MTMPRTMDRSTVVIPAQGMIEFRDALADLLAEFGTDDMTGDFQPIHPQCLLSFNMTC